MIHRTIVSACAFLLFAGSVMATPIVIDGQLNDWGLLVADNNGSQLTTFLPGIGLVGYHEEDQNDTAGHSFFLGPNYGGQDYDAELLAVALQGSTMYMAIVTGQRPDNGFSDFSPGDIRIVTSGGIYGIEVGGVKGGQPGPAITEGAPGATWTLKSDGTVQSFALADPLQTAGSIWRDVDWILDPIAPKQPTQMAINGASVFVGLADYIYTQNSFTRQHAVIELAVNLSVFGGHVLHGIYWRPSCGNDELNLSLNIVPEPATIALLAMGGLLWVRRPNR